MENSRRQTDSTTTLHLRSCTAGRKNKAKSGAYLKKRNVNKCNKLETGGTTPARHLCHKGWL